MPRAPKKCGRPGCEERVIGKPYCPSHQAEQQARANTTARGYGWQHQQSRTAALAALIGTPCTRCGHPVLEGQALDLDHTDDRSGYLGLAHRHCNAVAGATSKPASSST